MCGRYTATTRDADLVRLFDIEETVGEELPPSWNVAPTDPVRAVLVRTHRDRPGEAVTQLRTVRWGLVPPWAKDPSAGGRLINARAETVTERPSFRKAAASRRCLLPADGYYEWERRGGSKVPWFLHGENGMLAFAGLYEFWADPHKDPEDPSRWLWTATVVTVPATDTLGRIHDRTPVIVPPALQRNWLEPAVTEPAEVRDLLARMPEPHLVPTEVGPAVGNVRNNGPDLVRPV